MAILYPAARYEPLGPQTEPPMRAHNIICLHTMVGSLPGTDAYFERDGYGGTESHFGAGWLADGHTFDLRQWQDLARQADANGDGNDEVISIETADYGRGFPAWNTRSGDVPAWPDAWLDPLAGLIAWLCRRFDIPCQVIPDTRPGRRGIGWHRQGVDPWRVDSGVRWSSARGKVCPGDRRVAQIPKVVRRAARLLDAGTPPRPAPTPPPAPPRPAGPRLLYLTSPRMVGGDVGAVQRRLNRDYPAYSDLVVDEVFGPATDRTVREFQRRHPDLVEDGRVGPATRRALGL